MDKFQKVLLITAFAALSVCFAESATAKAQKELAVTDQNLTVSDSNTAKTETAPLIDAVVVKVNGKEITESQIAKELAPRMEQIAKRVPPNMLDQYKQRMRKQLIDQMIVEELLREQAKQDNIVIPQKEVEDEINSTIAKQNLSLDDFKALLNAYGKTYSEYKETVQKQMLFSKLLESKMAGNLTVPTVDEAKQYYSENKQQFEKPESINARHILISTQNADPNSDPNQTKIAAKAKAEDVLKQIKEGADFAEMAQKYSDCPSAKKGGDLGMAPKGSFVPEFEKAAYALEPNEVSDIVETQFGYHIIKLIAHQDANTVSFEEAKPQILLTLSNKEKQTVVMNYIQKIKKAAKIEFTNPADMLELPGLKPPRPNISQPDSNRKNDKQKDADTNKKRKNDDTSNKKKKK